MAIELSKEEIADVVPSIQKYMEEEFGESISEMKARFLLEYFMQELGPIAYNKGVADAERYFREKTEDLPAICYEAPMTYWPTRSNR